MRMTEEGKVASVITVSLWASKKTVAMKSTTILVFEHLFQQQEVLEDDAQGW